MAKVKKAETPNEKTSNEKKPETPATQTVTGTTKAEELQKSGRKLISAVRIGKDKQGLTQKEYTFRKE